MYQILLVDCDPAARSRFAQMQAWGNCGFSVADEAGSGASALHFLQQAPYDLMVIEAQLPFTDGIEIARQAVQLRPELCVVFISNCLDYEFVRRGLLLGAADYLPKSADEKTLLDALRRVRGKLDARADLAPPVLAAAKKLGVSAEKGSAAYRFCRYFSDHYQEGISLERMAEHFGYNKDYFGKIFREQMGVGFSQFHSALRMEYAQELLGSGSHKIYEVSEILGYSTVDYFTKIFRKYTGLSPSDYRIAARGARYSCTNI